MCTSYIAGLVETQNGLRFPLFCPGSMRIAEVEATGPTIFMIHNCVAGSARHREDLL